MNTYLKIYFARAIRLATSLTGIKSPRIIKRNGIVYEVDLDEGIDLSLFIFGSFQKHILDNPHIKEMSKNSTILDIGANCGAILLPLASFLDQSVIHAFEPTYEAFARLKRNVGLNQNLSSRIFINNCFVGESTCQVDSPAAFSAWYVGKDKKKLAQRHPVHLGTLNAASSEQVSIDDYVDRSNLKAIDFIKIDVDGAELEVLKGAQKTIQKFRPIIVFEASSYLLEEKGQSFDEYEAQLKPYGYNLQDSASGIQINNENFIKSTPRLGGIDIIAVPSR